MQEVYLDLEFNYSGDKHSEIDDTILEEMFGVVKIE